MPGRAHFYTKTPDQRLFPCRGSAHRAARVSPTVRLPGYIHTSIVTMKPIRFLGDSLAALRGFPADARHDAGYQLDQVQRGRQPADFKPMPSIGPGVEELRIWSDRRTFRVVYVARLPESVYVLHAFQKTSAATSRPDIAKARRRYMELTRTHR